MNKIDLNGRTAVVTGGAQGFGKAITERFVASGAKVAIWDHDKALADKTAQAIGNAMTLVREREEATDRAAFSYFQKACDAGYAPSCNGLGTLYAQGRGVAKDLSRAAQLYKSSCAAGASTGCEHLAEAFHRGIGIAQDAAAAERARARARCILKSASERELAACPAI